ncbi:MAG: glycosyltransferase family 2 protein [Actinomycetota bacterium]|nr:glycosyltransferase family 2 protein [Actinomycetota bacterium]
MPGVSVIIVSFNSGAHLDRCLSAVIRDDREVVVVDCASTDRSVAIVRGRYPTVRVLELDRNVGYGAGNNAGAVLVSGEYLLLLNPDAWPVGDAVDRLATFLDLHPRAALVGPRLLSPDGILQPSVRGFPTLWRLATEYFFLRWLAPRTQFLNAFYAANFDHRSHREAEFVAGAAMLVRRKAFNEVGGFDPAFFMFNEEVDLCRRLRGVGWTIEFMPEAEFIHVGGASTRAVRSEMYREQLRSHLRFLAKHESPAAAANARLLLLWAMRVRALIFVGERRVISRDAAEWLAARDVPALLAAAPVGTSD